jgi:BarA-like signal transduction histidine kinase
MRVSPHLYLHPRRVRKEKRADSQVRELTVQTLSAPLSRHKVLPLLLTKDLKTIATSGKLDFTNK